MLPELAGGEHTTFWVIPGDLTQAIRSVTEAFSEDSGTTSPLAARPTREPAPEPESVDEGDDDRVRELTTGDRPPPAVTEAAIRAAAEAEAAVNEAKSQVAEVERT